MLKYCSMASSTMHILPLNCNIGKLVPPQSKNVSTTHSNPAKYVRCSATISETVPVIRRSANYEPSIWDNNYIRSLTSEYLDGRLEGRDYHELKENVLMMFQNVVRPQDQLELINHLQRLGVAYLFDEKIQSVLKKIHNDHSHAKWELKDLYSTALEFRLLRQHKYHVPEDVFKRFTENGKFTESLVGDVKGMLSLYEASYYAYEGECLMEEAWCFTNKNLRKLDGNINDPNLAMHVKHALEFPLYLRMLRLEAKWYIEAYEASNDMMPTLLELAKLDFNRVQAIYRKEIKDVSSEWWNKIQLMKKLSFARDRLVSSFIWASGIANEPQFGFARSELTKAIQLISVTDDIYDIYSTLDEQQLLTDAIERWDINDIDQLPDYLKIFFLAVYNFVNEIVYHIYMEQNLDVLPYIKKAWLDLGKAYAIEAKWYASGYRPTLEEYLNVSLVSITGPIMTTLSYLTTANPIKREEIEFIMSNPDILVLISEIFRLVDDCATSQAESKRGDVPKAIQCYMSDASCSEEVAREHIRYLIRKKWKKVNTLSQFSNIPLTKSYIEMMLNLTKTAHVFYDFGDVYGVEESLTKDMVDSLIAQPIPLRNLYTCLRV